MLSFTFLGKDSYADFGITIKERPKMPLPKRQVDLVQVEGRDGFLVNDLGTYDSFTMTLDCMLVNGSDYITQFRVIRAWLAGGFGDIVFSDETDVKYQGICVNKVDLEWIFTNYGEFPLIFEVQPLKCAVSNSAITISEADIIVSDSFNRADNATSLGSPDKGSAWIPLIGTWGISSNKAYTTTTSGHSKAVVDSGVSDCIVEVVMSTSVAWKSRLIFRSVDVDNEWFALVGASSVSLNYRTAGVATTHTTKACEVVSGDILKVALNGQSIKLYVNNVLMISISNTYLLTATKHGFGTDSSNVVRFDDFKVKTLKTIIESPSGVRDGVPVIKLTATGCSGGSANYVDININGNVVRITELTGSPAYVTIDSYLMDCYRVGTLRNNYMVGNFHELINGTNHIAWIVGGTAALTSIEIIPNWRYI